MEHYATLFDKLYLPQGLALQLSMERHLENFCLWILCMDKETHSLLSSLNLNNVRLLKIEQVETAELLSVKPERSKGEYCWTLSPFIHHFVFEADDSVERVTYLDADLWFRKDPRAIFDELDTSGKSVLITDHNYGAEYDQSSTSGQYCVQYVTFIRHRGDEVRHWWEKRCLEWCYARFEDGKFGDQKYLDDWATRFSSHVHVLQNKELILAPWNATRFPYGNSIVWHFQGLRIINKGLFYMIFFGFYQLPKTTKINIYQEYLKDLELSINKIKSNGFNVRTQGVLTNWQKIREFIFDLLIFFKIPVQKNSAKIKISKKNN
jgi:hypothetical protein